MLGGALHFWEHVTYQRNPVDTKASVEIPSLSPLQGSAVAEGEE